MEKDKETWSPCLYCGISDNVKLCSDDSRCEYRKLWVLCLSQGETIKMQSKVIEKQDENTASMLDLRREQNELIEKQNELNSYQSKEIERYKFKSNVSAILCVAFVLFIIGVLFV